MRCWVSAPLNSAATPSIHRMLTRAVLPTLRRAGGPVPSEMRNREPPSAALESDAFAFAHAGCTSTCCARGDELPGELGWCVCVCRSRSGGSPSEFWRRDLQQARRPMSAASTLSLESVSCPACRYDRRASVRVPTLKLNFCEVRRHASSGKRRMCFVALNRGYSVFH